MTYKPITISSGKQIRATTDPKAQLYVLKSMGFGQIYKPLDSADDHVACLVNGTIRNVPRYKLKDFFETKIELTNKVCECGKEKHGFAKHSSWCDIKDV